MKTFLIMECVASYWSALAALAFDRWGDPLLACGMFATCGTVAIVGLALLERISMLPINQGAWRK
jgi:hypothetical protein